ncbi:nucleoside deaminase [Bradyrhizobium sp. WD16]|uniref:nucleoside deaminase n=1 Tax=Bradyrhizobium sp. WD16 TaxID=1521768 RepID=UPI0020A38C03|nr:nucleoside deaminase [Bradyrhizobium sp. WD16]UTD29829.1 nucleoside deaminase [Bradyrhizobium sp. WD16]
MTAPADDLASPPHPSDVTMMRRCIALAGESVRAGEFPFAAVVARGGRIVCESINRAKSNGDANSHAEVVAIGEAQRRHGTDLSECTLYTTVEPCALCAYAARESRLGRVVYGLHSPLMGGHSRWNILDDHRLSEALPDVFRPAPAIVAGFLQEEVSAVFRSWNPIAWQVIKARGIFVAGPARSTPAGSIDGLAARLLAGMRTLVIDRIGRT